MSSDLISDDFASISKQENISKLKELRESIRSCSDYTQKQIQNIDKTNLLLTTITLAISLIALIGLGLTFGYLKILSIFWIPSSFLLWFLWWGFGMIQAIIFSKKIQKNPIQTSEPPSEKAREMIIDDWLNKILKPAFIGIIFLYSMTLIFLVINFFSLSENQAMSIVPYITAVFFIVSSFFIKFNNKSMQFSKNDKLLVPSVIIVILLVVVLPFLSLMESSTNLLSQWNSLEGILLFLFVLIIQILLILIFISSISGIISSYEMNNILNGLAKINEEINELLLNENRVSDQNVNVLINRYQMTKKYDVEILRLFIFKTYMLTPNRVFLMKC